MLLMHLVIEKIANCYHRVEQREEIVIQLSKIQRVKVIDAIYL